MSAESEDSKPSLKYPIATSIEVSVHRAQDNPIFGEGTTKVRVEDEGGGSFIVLTQTSEESEGKLRFDLDELECVVKVAKELIANYPQKDVK